MKACTAKTGTLERNTNARDDEEPVYSLGMILTSRVSYLIMNPSVLFVVKLHLSTLYLSL